MFLLQLVCAVIVYGLIDFDFLPTKASTAQEEVKNMILNATIAAREDNIALAKSMELGFLKLFELIARLHNSSTSSQT